MMAGLFRTAIQVIKDQWFISLYIVANMAYAIGISSSHSGGRRNFIVGPPLSDFLPLGAMKGNKFLYNGEWWRSILFIPLHSGIISVLLNMGSLMYLALKLESTFNSLEVMLLYYFSSWLGGVVVGYLFPLRIYLGGPAGCCGILGGHLALLLSEWDLMSSELRRDAVKIDIINGIIQLFLGVYPHISILLALISLISGFCFALLSLNFPYFRQWRPEATQSPTSLGPERAPIYTPRRRKFTRISMSSVMILFCIAVSVFTEMHRRYKPNFKEDPDASDDYLI